ncbi:MAG: VTT domain-containing protein [Parcubacteria group bacterium]
MAPVRFRYPAPYMSSFIQPVINFLHWSADVFPLPVFAFLGALIEEIIAPIPSPLVMTLVGSLAAANDAIWIYLGLLAVAGAIGKTAGSFVVYFVADKGENIITKKFGKFLGASHREIEIIGKYLNKGWKDNVALFLLRAVPIMPTAPVSIVCGLIKLNLRTYLVSTFFGVMVRNAFYLYLGYTGIGALESVSGGIGGLEKIGYLAFLILIGVVFAIIYYHRRKGTGLKFLKKDED